MDVCSPVADARALFASKIAKIMAGDSMSAIAAAIWPPNAMPYCSRDWVAVIKVTALTDPYVAAMAAASKLLSLVFKTRYPMTGIMSARNTANPNANPISSVNPDL